MALPLEMIDRLRSYGVPDEDIEVLNDGWSKPVESVYTTSTKASQRQARWRAKKRLQASTETSTVDVTVCKESKKVRKEESKTTAPSTRGRRCPDVWEPSAQTRDWVFKKFGIAGDNLEELVAEFRDHWQSVPGSRGLKLDWDKTFKNRVRDVQGRYSKVQRVNGKPQTVHDVGRELYRRAVLEEERSGCSEHANGVFQRLWES